MKITVYGVPVAQGSMICVGRRGNRLHVVIDSKAKQLKPWRAKITEAATVARQRVGQLSGPLAVSATFIVPRPPSVSKIKFPWPVKRSAGDIDKLSRALLDGMTDSGLITDDSTVIHLDAWKCFHDSGTAPDQLDRPGVVIRMEPLP